MDKKYLDNGKAVYVTRELNPGYLVQDVYESDDFGEPYQSIYEKEYFVEKVHNKAPTLKYDNEIDELTKEIERLRTTKRTMQNRIKEIDKEGKERFSKYEQWEKLKLLDDFIDGKITHYAVFNRYNPKIIEFKNQENEFNGKGLKLLTLFGSSKGDLNWHLSEYRDGGAIDIVVPCQSYEQAREEMKKWNDNRMDIDNPESYPIKTAEEFSFEINLEYVKKYKAIEKDRTEKRIQECKLNLENLRKDLRKY